MGEEVLVNAGGLGTLAGSGPAPGRRAAGHPVSALHATVSARTWLAVIHLVAGFFIGMVGFIVVLTGLALGIGLLPAFLAGVPVLIATLWFSRLFARAERARFALLLGTDIPGTQPGPAPDGRPGWAGLWRALWRVVATADNWRFAAYALIRFPVSVVQFVVITVVWAVAVALLTVPAYNWALPGGAAHLGTFRLHNPAELALTALAGLVLLLAAPRLTRAFAVSDAAVLGWLLRAGRRADLTARIGELETSRAAVVDSAEAERRRIERDLHDGAQQRLVSLAMELGRARAKFTSDPAAAEAIVGQAHEQAKEALTELRNLVRGVHPPVLSDRGLDAALSGLAALSPVPVTVTVDLAARPPASAEAIAYFVVAEALTNIAKHARATHAEVAVCRSGGLLTVVISDDGIGGADPAGQGLSGLAARVAAVDGRFSMSSPPGGPTQIEVALPCGS
jgi:signal transduction histidine kinase